MRVGRSDGEEVLDRATDERERRSKPEKRRKLTWDESQLHRYDGEHGVEGHLLV